MEVTAEDRLKSLDEKQAKIDAERKAVLAEVELRKEIANLLPDGLREEYDAEGEAVKVMKAQSDDAKALYGVAREKQKSVERKIGDILNGEQLKVFLGANSSVAPSVGGIGRGKQGKRILELLEGGGLRRKDMVVTMKEEFNGADGHGAFDTLKKNGKITIIDGLVELV